MVVADASALGRFLLHDEHGDEADFAREVCSTRAMHVPQHWIAELASLIRKAHRRGRIDSGEQYRVARDATLLARSVTIEVEVSPDELVSAAAETGLSAYDASYLLLARRLAIPLLAFDGPLRRAAVLAGVEVLPS